MRKCYLIYILLVLFVGIVSAEIVIVKPPIGLIANASLLNVNSSNYWDNLNTPADFSMADDWISVPGGVFTFNGLELNDTVKSLFTEQQVVYNATLINTAVGTLDSGDLNSIKELADGDTYNVSEVSGAPGFLIYINFTDIVNFNTVALRGMYDGGAGHTLALELFRVGVGWEERAEITDQSDWGVTTFPVFIGSNFIDGDGTVQFRINHDDNGVTAHNYFLDAVFIGQIPGLVTGGDLADLTGRDNACELLPEVFCKDGSKAMTGNISAENYNLSVDNVFTNNLVPYTGATANVNLGVYTFAADLINTNTVTTGTLDVLGTSKFAGDINITGNINATEFFGAWNGSVDYVPYTGAIQDLDMNSNDILNVGEINATTGIFGVDDTATKLKIQAQTGEFNDILWFEGGDTKGRLRFFNGKFRFAPDGSTDIFRISTSGISVNEASAGAGYALNMKRIDTSPGIKQTYAYTGGGVGGEAINLAYVKVTNIDDASSVDPAAIWGWFGRGGDPPTSEYQFFDTRATGAYNVATLKVDSENRVGIGLAGTTRPSYPLDVRTNVSGISIYSEANVSADEYLVRTSVFDKSKGNALDFIYDSDSVKNPDGSINHLLLDGGRCYNATDWDRPVLVGKRDIDGDGKLEDFYEYPYEKEVCDSSLSQQVSKHEQSFSELKAIIYELNETIKFLEATCVRK